jgi:hypothetical protein
MYTSLAIFSMVEKLIPWKEANVHSAFGIAVMKMQDAIPC